MKTLELELKKKVLIVDAENGFKAFDIIFENFSIEESGKYEFLCKGSELTEEIASELVEEHYMSGVRSYEIYNDYRYNDARWLDNALESFISAVESKEKFWFKNPIGIIERGEDTEHNRVLNQNKWQEAEEKTFKNPLIFVKK